MTTTERTRGPSAGRSDRVAGPLPLVGRAEELEGLEALLNGPTRQIGAVLLRGDGGSGKSRIADELSARAQRRGWTLAHGRAYPVERGIPYALFSDAFLPMLRAMDPDLLAVLTRGGEAELRYLFPALGAAAGPSPAASGADPDEFRTRLFWNFAELVKSYASRTPLLIVLDDLHWADESSLELLHFLVRQTAGHPVLAIGIYNEAERDRSPGLVRMERSLLSLGFGRVLRVEPLGRAHVTDLVCRMFSVDADVVREFSAMLFGWTHGNPFFAEEILKSLVASGRLSRHEGTWIGWDATDFGLPGSIRDAVVMRLSAFSENARTMAELVAVVGARASHPLLASTSGLAEAELLAALEELCGHHVLSERTEDGLVVYEFRHPLVRETLYQELGLQRARVLHGAVAEAMECHWGPSAMEHADELAYHFARTDAAGLAAKAVRYLGAAGRRALSRHADREAADYLRAAGERVPMDGSPESLRTHAELGANLARAHLRLGNYEAAVKLWTAGLAIAPPGTAEHATLRRSLGLATFWLGRHDEALAHFEEGLASAETAGDDAGVVHLRLVRTHCLQELGRGREAKADMEAALPAAERLEGPELLARVHRALALLHVWIGPPAEAERHARRAIELAGPAGNLAVEFWARWGLAVLWGMSGKTARMAEGIEDARALADRLRSPVLRLWTAEMSIELAYGKGEWDHGVALGERSIALARSLNQTTLLPRLLVWTSTFYVGRGSHERAKALVDEACEIAGVQRADGQADVHMLVPAYIGLANYRLGIGDHAGAMEAARKGLAIAEGTGYTLWVVHRLLPILCEACIWAGDLDEAEELARRMRRHSEGMDHKLGIAWADAGDALLRWKRGDPEGGARAMRAAAEALEKIPMVPDAVRIRRQLAGRLAETGDVTGALAELRTVHDVLAQLGAESELERARTQFRELGHRPPPRGSGEGMAGLTAREVEICRLVARRKSNKAIGKDLGISPRTVSTHLSNVFQKLDVGSRAELGDFVRDQGMLDG